MTEEAKPLLQQCADGVLLQVRVKPGSAHRGVRGVSCGRLVVCVNSQPEKGRANREALKLVGDFLGVPASRIRLANGASSRYKTFLITGTGLESIAAKLFNH